MTFSTDQSGTYSTLSTAAGDFGYFSLSELERMGAVSLAHLPYSIRVLLENALRNTHNESTFSSHVEQIAKWGTGRTSGKEFPFMPGRVVLQDFTGVPAIVDLAAMRDAITRAGQDPTLINPVVRSDLVIDHSVQVDYFASEHALNSNIELEFERKL
jgi:aconitate hydratase